MRTFTVASKPGCNIPITSASGQTDRDGAHHRQDIRASTDMRLTGILAQCHIFDVMQPVFDLPVSSLECRELYRTCCLLRPLAVHMRVYSSTCTR